MDWTTVPQAGLRAKLASFGLCLATAMQAVHAGPTDLADIPMANSSRTNILPNIMLDIDNSGSMSWNYMPDHVRYQSDGNGFATNCRGPSGLITCELSDPPTYASGFNSLYYNPEIRYNWPVTASGGRLADRTNARNTSYRSPWSAVASDGYGQQEIEDTSGQVPDDSPCNPAIFGGRNNSCPTLNANATINLVTGYPERKWCTNANDLSTCKSALDSSNNYSYPNGTYQYLRVVRGAPFYYNVTVQWCKQRDSQYPRFGSSQCQDKKTSEYKYVRYTAWSRVDIVSSRTSYPKAVTRTDCAGSNCTYDEEMSNFATWYAWYRTRAQMAKSAIGLAFGDVRGTPIDGDLVDASYLHARIGLTAINDVDSMKLNIGNFDNVSNSNGVNQKATFYANLYGFNPSGGTSLRASLKSVGAMYAGDTSVYADPVQFSCQKNYAILATDGYWNDTARDAQHPNGDFIPPDTAHTDQDGDASRPSKDDLATPNTLADVAYYYYHTDLRTNCDANHDLCTNNVTSAGSNQEVDDVAQYQHMTTFTIGLGVDGTLKYDPSYKTSTSGDYFNIKQGTQGYKWPAPSANKPETIDDLWHAAVNGRGTYFSTKNPATLESGLRKALSSIDSTSGSGAAAATSNLLPTQGDSSIFMATYRTLKWDAEVSAYGINLTTGVIDTVPAWQAEPLLRARVQDNGTREDRVIYTGRYDASGAITQILFSTDTRTGLTQSEQNAYFDARKLSQYDGWTTVQQAAATPATMLNYLRGQDRYEDQGRPADYPAYQRLYRDREKILGDIVHAQPIYVKKTMNTFVDDSTFATYKNSSAMASRLGTLYVASNDGMLHAFDSTSGQERWAFIPPQLLPNLYKLADVNYESNHRYFLDGPMTINDAKVGNSWKTVLIGAMGKGGRGYYALDVTDPTAPRVMWDFTADKDANLGYTFGAPLITKRGDGRWVAIVTSGYNNVPESDGNGGYRYTNARGEGYGQGFVYVLDIADGRVLTKISTGVGTSTNPSGLAWINAFVDKFDASNQEVRVYGGDLTGTMWRFDIDNATATHLIDLGPTHPIMVAPELGEIDHNQAGTQLPPAQRIKTVYFGTGRYLGRSDLPNTDAQTLYGIKDDGTTTVSVDNLRAASATGDGPTRAVTGAEVNWDTGWGWKLPLNDSGERVAVNPRLYFGTVVFSTTVPSISPCQPGGFSWLYQLDAETGGAIPEKAGAMKFNSPVVGVTMSQLPNGKPIIHAVTADGRKPDPTDLNIGLPPPAPKRVLYRELTN